MTAIHVYERNEYIGLNADMAAITAGTPRDGARFIATDAPSGEWIWFGGGWKEIRGPGMAAYGHCYGNEVNQSIGPMTQNTWYPINDTDMSDGLLNLITHDGSGKLTVTYAGIYRATYSISWESNANNVHFQSGILINGAAQSGGIQHHETSFVNVQFNTSSFVEVSLAAGATVQAAVRSTDPGTPTVLIDHVNLDVTRLKEQ